MGTVYGVSHPLGKWTPDSDKATNEQRQGITITVVSCLLCYISLFFHWKVWYTQLNKSKVIGEIAMSFQELFNKFFAKGKPF